jgi:hypothetical protein
VDNKNIYAAKRSVSLPAPLHSITCSASLPFFISEFPTKHFNHKKQPKIAKLSLAQ